MVPTPSATSRLTNSPMARIMPLGALSLEWPGARTLADPRRGGAHLAGHQPPPGLDLVRGVDQLRGLGAGGHRGVPLPGRRRRHRDPAPADRALARHLARRGPRHRGPASATATAWPGRGLPSRGCGSTRRSCCSTPTRGRSAASWSRTRRSSATPSARRETRDLLDSAGKVPLSVVVDDRFDWGGDRPAAAPVARHRDLRAARQGDDPAARPGARASCAAPTPGSPPRR